MWRRHGKKTEEECAEGFNTISEASRGDESHALSAGGISRRDPRSNRHLGRLLCSPQPLPPLGLAFTFNFWRGNVKVTVPHPKFWFRQNWQTQQDFLFEVQRIIENRAVETGFLRTPLPTTLHSLLLLFFHPDAEQDHFSNITDPTR